MRRVIVGTLALLALAGCGIPRTTPGHTHLGHDKDEVTIQICPPLCGGGSDGQ